MPYTSQADLERTAGGLARLTELCDQANTGALDAAALTNMAAAQAQADAWIDGYLQRMYTVPFTETIPIQIVACAAEETVYILKRWRQTAQVEDHERHAARQGWINGVQAGLIIPGADPYPIGGGGSAPVVTERSDDDYDVTRGNLKGFV